MSHALAAEGSVAMDSFPSTTKAATSHSTAAIQFDPAKHLAYSPPSNILKVGDLALPPTALSSVASTEPFPLLSHEAVLQHRREIFSADVLDNCLHYTRPGSVQIRGMAPRYAPFIHSFWHSPQVLKIITENAGVDLVPAMDYEISHTNAQLGPDGIAGVRATPVQPPAATEEAIAQFEKERPKPEVVTERQRRQDPFANPQLSQNVLESSRESIWTSLSRISRIPKLLSLGG